MSQAQSQPKTAPLTFKPGPRKIGSYEIHALETGTFALDGGAMFGIVPKTIWEKTNPSDELNRIEMRARCLLLVDQAAGRLVLVDNGMGAKWADKFAQMYKVDSSVWSLEQSLAKLGYKPDDVTDLIATHLHFDHMGGTTRRLNGELVPVFEKARVWVQERNWKHASAPNEKDRASYLTENFELLRGDSKLRLLQTGDGAREEILPGVFVRVTNGHTLGMQMVEVADESTALIYCADTVPTASHVKVPFVMGYDCFPLTTMAEKKALLSEAADRGMILFFEHCPRADAASVFHDGKDFAVKQAYRF